MSTGIATRSIVVWLVMIMAEIVHGIARAIFLVPHVGEFRSNQIGVFTGSIMEANINQTGPTEPQPQGQQR